MKYLLVMLCGCLLMSSCVSNKKYRESQSSLAALQKQNRDLNEDLSDVRSRLQLMEDANQAAAGRLSEQDSTLTEKQKQLAGQQEQLASQQKRLTELQALINQQRVKTENLRKKMAEALGNFNSEDLSVFKKNGKVYVRMSEKLLFPSGSAVVNKEGKDALAKLAVALNQNPDININIEGHTDTVPIKIKYPDNWALSVARATAIVRILVNDYHVHPDRLTASGRSQYDPVADNATAEGRAKNRRTEIILAPKLDELMQLINDSDSTTTH
ncbi:MAG TPA: OmpA family protein [Edaphocola sp.]|nr:OmpA family protein [Edaphocola sp.]